jgi:hypothetical protein
MAAECMIWLYAATIIIYEVKLHGIGKGLSFQFVSENILIISTNQATVPRENVTKHTFR